MNKQVIISIGRQFGSGGQHIGVLLSERYGIKYYDHKIIDEIALNYDKDPELLKRFDEKPKIKLFHRKVKGYSTSLEDHIASMEFEFLKKKAAEGESFVVIGRCAEHVLKGNEALVPIFIVAEAEDKVRRIMEREGLDMKEAIALRKKTDMERKAYHNYYTDGKWGDPTNYGMIINSTTFGVDGCINMVDAYLKEKGYILDGADNE